MAQRVTVALEDDLDGGSAAETVRFGYGGATSRLTPSVPLAKGQAAGPLAPASTAVGP
jgi:hypothetical protein